MVLFVGVLHTQYFDTGYLAPIESAIRQRWERIVCRHEQQTIGVIQIYRQMALQIALQFVTPRAGDGAERFEILHRNDFRHTTHDQLGLSVTPIPLERSFVAELFLKFAVLEYYIQAASMLSKFIHPWG
jgi:hypothetical protein